MQLPRHVKRAIKSGPVPVIRDWRELTYEQQTLGERVCSFIERHIIIPEGSLVGKPVSLDVFQVAFILSVYDNPHGTSLAIFSVARKNAKTALIAFLVLAHLVGPLAVRNSRLNSGAMSRQQASEVYNYASKAAALSPTLRDIVKSTPSSKTIHGLTMGTEYRALGADASTNIGGSPIVAILDELGQIRGAQSDFVDAITTAQAAYDDPLLFYISTQSTTSADLLSIAIDDAIVNQPKHIVCHVYEADPDCDVMDEEQWLNANPALGKFRNLRDMREQAEKAQRMPSFRNTFRNLLLNQRVASFSTFIDPEEWRKNNTDPLPLNECEFVYGGLDLSSHRDLTALILVGLCSNGKKHVHARFWTPLAGLEDRQKEDKAPYDVWVEEGYLTVVNGATIDYEYVAEDIANYLYDNDINIDSLGFDRWRIDLFKKELDRIGLDLPLVEVGQGFKDMGPALDSIESDILAGRICHGDNPVLNMCAINAVSVTDPASNRKLEKRRASGRIDGMVALATAASVILKSEIDTGPTDEEVDEYYKSLAQRWG